MAFVLVHFILDVFFSLFQGFEILFHLLLGKLALWRFGLVFRLIFILFFLFRLFLIFLILLFLLFLFLFFKQGPDQVIPCFTICRIKPKGIFPGINAFFQLFLADHGNAFVVIGILSGILSSLGL